MPLLIFAGRFEPSGHARGGSQRPFAQRHRDSDSHSDPEMRQSRKSSRDIDDKYGQQKPWSGDGDPLAGKIRSGLISRHDRTLSG